jgi:cold shock CspA family protein
LVHEHNYGFIRDATGNEVFFAASSMERCAFSTLRNGQLVTYELGWDGQELARRAEQVRVLPPETLSAGA